MPIRPTSWLVRTLVFTIAAVLAACSQQETPVTEVVVAIDADDDVAANLTRVEVATYDPAAGAGDSPITSANYPSKNSGGKVVFPFSVGVAQGKGDRFLMVVTGYAGEDAVIEQKAFVNFAKRQIVGFGMLLASPCYGQLCAGLASSTWLTQTCSAQSGMCGDVQTAETKRVKAGAEFDAGLVTRSDDAEPDLDAETDSASDVDAEANAQAEMDAASEAGNDSDAAPDDSDTGPDAAAQAEDFALGVAGQPCAASQNQTLACEGHTSRKVLKCNVGIWELFQTCAESERCDSRLGAGQGTCVSMPALCANLTEAPADVCDGTAKKTCGPDLVSLTDSPCSPNAHCEGDSPASCVCDAGYDDDGQGGCTNHDDCPKDACAPGGTCVDGLSDYSCDCGSGFAGTGTKACTAVVYCPKDACTPGGSCVDQANWFCHCDSGFSGEGSQACSNIDDCPPYRCRAPNGTCQDGVNTYKCVCSPGYSGPDCATDACNPNPCQHGGACTRTQQGASCACGASGYGGATCSIYLECATTNLCSSPDYPCVPTAPTGYTCQGQFAVWPMPDALAGSKAGPSYDTGTAGVVIDKVYALHRAV